MALTQSKPFDPSQTPDVAPIPSGESPHAAAMNERPRPLKRLLERWHFDRHPPAGPLTTAERMAVDERDGGATGADTRLAEWPSEIAESVDPQKTGSAS